ncbi:Kinesin-like protein NACK1 [Platanthera guangdongensis]|uniref:Kinesin-like protein n=1 Tax=Platanthera guangdongensis TaxID=2320717 RepID=A0ABR2MPQ8_9ASPA
MGSNDGDEAENGGEGGGKEEKIYVSVRVRPLSSKEIEKNDHSDWEIINNTTLIFKNSLPDRSMLPSAYIYDRVFGYNCDTRKVYEEGAKEIALSVVSGINSSIFAYGQTSSGKTYTMNGITEYFVEDIYEYIDKHEERKFFLKFSAMEIYNEAVRDLLSSDSTPLRLLDDPERGTFVDKLTEEMLRDRSHLKELLGICEAQRQIGETSLNEASSRSHQILRLTIESSARQFRASSLSASVNFVDLAGSERASQTLSAGTRLKEGSHINRSLLTLGTVIRKLSKGTNGHVPYRDSKLTRILQNSLGGNARTAIICTMSPARSHIEQSKNTLLFASCAKEVATSARVNVVMSDKSLIKHLRRELARLEDELRYVGLIHKTTHVDELKEKDTQIIKMEKEISELSQQRDLAHSRLRNLLSSVADDQASRVSDESGGVPVHHAHNPSEDGHYSRYWEESSQLSVYHAVTSEDESSVSEASGICYRSPEFSISKFKISNLNNIIDPNQQPSLVARVPENSTGSARNIPQNTYKSLETASETSEASCKVVQCVEINGSIQNKDEFSHLLDEDCDNFLPKTLDHTVTGFGLALEHHVRVRQASVDLVKGASSFSATCEENLVSGSNSFGLQNQEKGFPRTENLPSGTYSIEGDTESEEPSGVLPKLKNSSDKPLKVRSIETPDKLAMVQGTRNWEKKHRGRHSKTASEAAIPSISDLVEELKEMDQVQHQNQLTKNQELPHTSNENYKDERNVKDGRRDPLSSFSDSPYEWPLAFEKLQRELIELWDAYNVSLIHRADFFLRFKGKPTDSSYMEEERMFLKKMLSQESETETLSSRKNELRREREKLHKCMLKKLSSTEREDLYKKWGIKLDSKRRRMQLAQRLWTDTKNIEHVRGSALLVARLNGHLEPEQAIKEMFGLSFTLQKYQQKSSIWKRISSFR